MQKKATLTTLSKDLGISVGTISRILNGKAKAYRISDKTIKQVLEHAEKIGYSPNLLARGLRSSKTMMLGLIIPDISNPFFAQLAKQIERTASQFNYTLVFIDSDESIGEEKRHLKNLLARKVDGIIVAPVGIEFEHFAEVKRQEIPIVMVDRYATGINIPYFATDNYWGAKTVTNYLIEKGHKRIALIKGDDQMITVKERLRGYLDALKENQIKAEPQLVLGNGFNVSDGTESAMALLDMKEPPTAIFAMSNQIGLGVLEAMSVRKLKIPDEISLVVYDDQPYAAHIQPPLSTVKQDINQIGKCAVEGILSLIENPESAVESRLMKSTFMERSSVFNLTD